MSATRRVIAASLLVAFVDFRPVLAQALDPSVSRIETLYASLVEAMKNGGATPSKLKPVVEKDFNVPIMAQFAVGSSWATMAAKDREAIIESITRYTATRYARDFPTFHGQRFSVTPKSQERGLDRLVKSEIVNPGEAPDTLMYRLREYDGSWRIIDVYFNGISQLATQRSDFASSLSAGGAANLVRKLDEATSKLK